jgi:hypothetical protein
MTPLNQGGLQSGGRLLLNAGDTWTATAPIAIRGWGSGGSNEGPAATVGAYSTEPIATQQRPWIRRTAEAGVGPVLSLTNCAGLEITGLEISGGEQGVLFSYDAPRSPAWGGLVVSDCYIHGIRGTRPASGSALWWATGVGFNTTGRTDVVASNIVIVNNIFNDSDVA